jgi:hypothetical protein
MPRNATANGANCHRNDDVETGTSRAWIPAFAGMT